MSVEPIKGKNSKWGCYFNRDDPRVFVYRHDRYKAVGVTLNFAKIASWVWLVFFIALLFVGMVGTEWLRRSSLITSFDRVVRDAIYAIVCVVWCLLMGVACFWLAARDLKRHPGPQSARP